MEITQLIEKNPTLLRLGLHLEYNDARHRIATHLQRNIDTSEYKISISIIYTDWNCCNERIMQLLCVMGYIGWTIYTVIFIIYLLYFYLCYFLSTKTNFYDLPWFYYRFFCCFQFLLATIVFYTHLEFLWVNSIFHKLIRILYFDETYFEAFYHVYENKSVTNSFLEEWNCWNMKLMVKLHFEIDFATFCRSSNG